eukprot:1151621-Pelagomonas_calceolata.AAC.1
MADWEQVAHVLRKGLNIPKCAQIRQHQQHIVCPSAVSLPQGCESSACFPVVSIFGRPGPSPSGAGASRIHLVVYVRVRVCVRMQGMPAGQELGNLHQARQVQIGDDEEGLGASLLGHVRTVKDMQVSLRACVMHFAKA